jgi:hypothetical protein
LIYIPELTDLNNGHRYYVSGIRCSISGQDGEHSINDDEVSAAVLDALGDVPYYDEQNGDASGINNKRQYSYHHF